MSLIKKQSLGIKMIHYEKIYNLRLEGELTSRSNRLLRIDTLQTLYITPWFLIDRLLMLVYPTPATVSLLITKRQRQ